MASVLALENISVEFPAAVIAALFALAGTIATLIGNSRAKKRESLDRRLEILLEHNEAIIERQDTQLRELEAELGRLRQQLRETR